MARPLFVLPLRWSPDLGIDWSTGIVAYRVTTCPEHSRTFTGPGAKAEAGAHLRRAAQDGRCPTCGDLGTLYTEADLVSASGRPWVDLADEYDPDPDPTLGELFAAPSMLGVSKFERAP